VLNHVTNRGNDRMTIFREEADYLTFLRMLGEVIARRGWIRHAYCLLPNHYHLLLECPADDLGSGMHMLNGPYSRRFNARYARVGHVFQGRYRAEPVTRDAHFLEACRYIVLNPVRAGLCSHPAEWPWSSYGDEQTELVTGMIGDRSSFEAFVLAGIERLLPA
jgi:putative transposase